MELTMAHNRKAVSKLVAAAIVGLGIPACGGENVIGPENQLQVNNAADNFQWQASNLEQVTQTLSYPWQNSGTVANVNQSSSVTGGSVTVTIRDAASAQVYSRGQAENGTFQTSAGTSGGWTIDVVLSNASGTVNFRVQKGP